MMTERSSFTVMTMNLRFGLARDGENAWDCRKNLVGTFLARTSADFIGFQEVNHFQAGFLAQALPGFGSIGRYNLGCPWWQSNMIFFRKAWTCLGSRHLFLSPFPDIPSKLAGSKWPRQCVIGWFERAGQQVLAVNTHMDFDPGVQAKSAGLIAGFLDRFPKGLPTVITGDFNAEHNTPAFRAFQVQGFGEVFQHDPPGTFHGFTGTPGGKHIDWILYRGGLLPRRPRILTFHRGRRYPSDHFPVTARFFLEEA